MRPPFLSIPAQYVSNRLPRPALPHRNIPPALALRTAASPLPPPLAHAGYGERQLLLRLHARVRVFKWSCDSRCTLGGDADRYWKGRGWVCCRSGVGYDSNDVSHTNDKTLSNHTLVATCAAARGYQAMGPFGFFSRPSTSSRSTGISAFRR